MFVKRDKIGNGGIHLSQGSQEFGPLIFESGTMVGKGSVITRGVGGD